MPVLSFLEINAVKVAGGCKRQTIRRVHNNPIKPGDRLFLFAGLRTKKARNILNRYLEEAFPPEWVKTDLNKGRAYVICSSIEDIQILPSFSGEGRLTGGSIKLGDKQLDLSEALKLAKDDGFANYNEFWKFFYDHYGLPFKGVLIKW